MPAFYIVLQEKIPGVNANTLEGRALSKHSDMLTGLATQAGVTPLMNFFSADPGEMAGLLEDHAVDVKIPNEAWFPADEGLKTIAVLLAELDKEPSASNSDLVAELKEFEQVLQAARTRNVSWHLAIDY